MSSSSPFVDARVRDDGERSRRSASATTSHTTATSTQASNNNNNNNNNDSNTDDVGDALSSFFAHGQPKDVLSGVAQGVGNVLMGVGSGVLSAVAAPVIGAREDGVVGAARGLALGLAGAAAMTLYGVATGTRQMCVGLANTPQALRAVARGEQLWDSAEQQWQTVMLQREWQSLPVTDEDIDAVARDAFAAAAAAATRAPSSDDAATASSNNSSSSAAAAASGDGRRGDAQTTTTTTAAATTPSTRTATDEDDYYALLGVSRGASTAELRRAYTQQALLLHPDKNPHDADATRRFQRLLQAYKTLSNPSTRVLYDQRGHGGGSGNMSDNDGDAAYRATVATMSADDSNPIAEMLAASFLEPLVGHLAFLDYFRVGVLYTAAQRQELYRRRRLRIARTLCSFLDREDSSNNNSNNNNKSRDGDDAGFAAARDVLHDAAGTRLGPPLVAMIAEQYAAVARQHLHDNALLRELDSWLSSKHVTLAFARDVVSTTVHTTLAALRQRRLGEAEAEQLLVLAVETDVRRTVARACRLVLYDRSVTAEQRARRAQRLAALAQLAMHEVEQALAARHASPSPSS